MRRLIDANALKREIRKMPWAVRKAETNGKEEIEAIINDAPTVDAVEVVHGRCEYCKDGKSFIGARLILGNDGEWHEINHCPNCGAKKDGDVNV